MEETDACLPGIQGQYEAADYSGPPPEAAASDGPALDAQETAGPVSDTSADPCGADPGPENDADADISPDDI